ncbi:IMS-domain-containing protein [Artomyces pyxidatus]|uniref:IMS-domain-containing protein n=1 Tax=Artomyces pyxidatus TaxID=48021 RepID=A0ACB8TCZ1_9AGAM|nr:IMS-domain-containing protein [Artomyces pyxidatus]
MATNTPAPSQETASLVQRLAGPSTGKAGLAKDQTEINRIIADASKGSKFYENEKRKDKDLTERISRILRQRDDALKDVDIVKVEYKVDRLLAELEEERDLSQYIVHVDMDAFYANVELLDDPSLAGKPFGVGHGVLSTASYEARKYGVRSGMPGFIAKKLCPELITVPIHMSRYSELSKNIMAIFRQYDENMLAASVDEAYMNITRYCTERNLDPDECVQQMRQRVVDETHLTVSAGIAANKMLAKICSDKNKPNGQYHLPHNRDAIKDFMRDLSIRKIPGVGRVNERLLESIGIKTCGDIHKHRGVLSLMDKQFGLRFMLRTHLGIASNLVQPWLREKRKSIGSERTFNAVSNKDKILEKLEEIAAELEEDMESSGWTGRTVTLKYKLDTYQVFTRAKSFDRWITKKEDLFATGKELLQPEWPLRIRLIGLRVTKLKDTRKKDDGQGIKRFFEPVGGSPSKRQKTHHDDGREDDGDDDTMPGFHEHEPDLEFTELQEEHGGWDGDEAEAEAEDDLPTIAAVSNTTNRPRPPVSAPLASPSRPSSRAKPHSSTGLKPTARTSAAKWQDDISAEAGLSSEPSPRISTSKALDEHMDSVPSDLPCPLCACSFVDNNALNAHIDWCLSREAIRAAQVEAGERKTGMNKKKPKMDKETNIVSHGVSDGRTEWWKAQTSDKEKSRKRKA